jgi:hypothetical protein
MAALILLILALAIWALPAMLIALAAQRYLVRNLHWRLSFLLWFATSMISLFIIYQQYQISLQPMMSRVLGLYIAQSLQHHANFLQWNIRMLWPATWSMWLHTLIAIPIAGLWYEVSYQATGNVTRMLRQNEQHRQNRAQRSQQQAKRRANRPDRLPDEAGGMMVMGVPIKKRKEE